MCLTFPVSMSTYEVMKKLPFLLPVAVALAVGITASGAQLDIPTTTINGTDVFSGPSFTVSGDFALTDFISVEAVGTVDLSFGSFTANAAGVITAPPITNTGASPGQTSPALDGATLPGSPYAALLIGNTTLGFHLLFPADAAAGLGSASPPTDIFATRTISEIFGAPISNGTLLEFRVNDINTDDNSGAFRLLNAGSVSNVPEGWSLCSSILVPLTVWSALLFFRFVQVRAAIVR